MVKQVNNHKIHPYSLPVTPLVPPKKTFQNDSTQKVTNINFGELLQKEFKKTDNIKFSAHAQRRLEERNINLDKTFMEQVNEAFAKVESKGAKQSLLLLGDVALIASVKNKTIVTAMDGENMNDHVFTNIDSAVIIK